MCQFVAKTDLDKLLKEKKLFFSVISDVSAPHSSPTWTTGHMATAVPPLQELGYTQAPTLPISALRAVWIKGPF